MLLLSGIIKKMNDSQTKRISGFIRPYTDVRAFGDFAKKYCSSAVYILHDKDRDSKSGLEIPHHVHFVCLLKERTRLSSFRNRLADFLGVPEISISAQRTVSDSGAIQYLIHKNEKDKYHYSPDELQVFGLTPFELDCLLDQGDALNFDYLVYVISDSKNLSELIERIGLQTYRSWRWVILDLWKVYH